MNSFNDSIDEYKKSYHNSQFLQSYEKYLQRLKSYQTYKWFAKPKEFSPIECAKRGWINLDKDSLKCVSCSNILFHYSSSSERLFKIRDKEENAEQKDFKKTTDPICLVEAHNHNCPWKNISVPDKFIQIDVYHDDLVYKHFLTSMETFKNCSYLPILNENIYKMFIHLNQTMSEVADVSSQSWMKVTFVILVCCGWSYNKNRDVLNCDRCLRSIGLWLYEKDLNPRSTNSGQIENDNVSKKNVLTSQENRSLDQNLPKNEFNGKRKHDEADETIHRTSHNTRKKSLNPIAEHYSWCPWLTENGQTFSAIDQISNSPKLINKNCCHIFYEIVLKQAKKLSQSSENVSKIGKPKLNNSDEMLEKIKLVKNLLVNCTSPIS